jgi:hypothetical protein
MAKITGPLFSLAAHGTLGNMLTFQSGPRGNVAKIKSAPSGAASSAQLAQRATYAAGCAAWLQLDPIEKASMTPTAHAVGLSVFSYFLSTYLNAPPAPAGAQWDGGASVWDAGASTWD